MAFLIVKSPDGDMYYSKDRNASISRAVEAAAQAVAANDREEWTEEEVQAIAVALAKGDEKRLRKLVEECGALREGRFQ